MTESTKIYYFSGTGNSLAIAKNLQSKLKNVELISIPQLMKNPGDIIIEGDVIGFVFPVYFFRVPVVVEELIERTVFGKTTYIFAITNGGGAFCRTLKIFNTQLKGKKTSLNAGFTIGMPGNHPKVYDMIKKTSAEYFAEKNKRIDEISEIILSKKNHHIETNFGLLGFLLSHVLFKKTYNDSKKHLLDSAIRIKESCKQCGTCKKLCPANNIELTSSGPKWHGKCLNCARCFHLCPNEVIELGEDTMPRYINPEVELRELV
ncbi:MAG: EFR1 family ferrodoxin [Spirochaetes bacterium]|nr:EFR1 family ferrodoxin [Spirochaetota bacterium]